MITRANTTVAVLRGTTTDDYGDPVDSNTEVATGIPASILERRRDTTTPDDGQPRTVIFYTGRVPYGTDLQEGDRIKDERTSEVYVIDDHTRTENPLIKPDVRLDLRRVS